MYTAAPWLTGGPAASASAIWTSRGVVLSTWRTVVRSTALPARSWPAGEMQAKAMASEAARTGCIGHLRGHGWCVIAVCGREPAKGCTAASGAGALANRLPAADRCRRIDAGEAVHATLDRWHATHQRQELI